jgi:flagellar biosynthesis protein FlhG
MNKAGGLRQMVDREAGRPDPTPGLSEGIPRVIAVTSGKGGVGKTNIAGNLAIAFRRMGKRVLILDADLGLANLDIIFGLTIEHNIKHVISGEKSLSDVLVRGPEGICIIPAGSGMQDLAELTGGQKLDLLSEFDRVDDSFDIFLIDTCAGISSNVTYFNIAAGERIVVVTPEPTSITDAYALIKVLYTKHGTNTYKILVNMTTGPREAEFVYRNLSNAVDRFLGNVSMDYVGFIPTDANFGKAVRKQQPIIGLYPETAASKSITEIGKQIIESSNKDVCDGNIKFFWKKIIGFY